MHSPFQRTLVSLAVATACGMPALAAHAQEAPGAANPGAAAADPVANPAAKPAASPPADPPAAPEPAGASTTVVVSGSRIAARGFSQPIPTRVKLSNIESMSSATRMSGVHA